jgi:hypothetical protein
MLALLHPVAVLAQPGTGPARPPATRETKPDIRDIRGPKAIENPWRLPLEIGAAAALLAAGYAIWRRRAPKPPPSPRDLALERLATARQLLELGRARKFSIELSAIVREFIEAQYHLQAAHRTTDEFLRTLLAADSPLAGHRGRLAKFLEACDVAKFGGWQLSLASMEALYASAHDFLAAGGGDAGGAGDGAGRVGAAGRGARGGAAPTRVAATGAPEQ